MTIQGKIISIKEKQDITDKFSKRCVWIETDGDYPQTLEIQFVNAQCSLLDSVAIGEVVDIEFDLRGRISKDRVFNSLNGWKISVVGSRVVPQQRTAAPAQKQHPILEEPLDDLPF